MSEKMPLTSRFRRLGTLTREEILWRTTVAGRAAAQRVAVRLQTPQWDRHDIRDALAGGLVDESMRRAIAAEDWRAVHHALAQAIRTRPARFVLDPASAHELTREIRTRWPDSPSAAAERADRILAGSYDLLGYRGLTCAGNGSENWHRDAVHNREARRVFWADVPYLDPAVGDHKVIWELNRHQHWLQLGRALWLTGDVRYRRGIVQKLNSWLAANPPLVGINWASMLEIGFRAMSWTWALHFLLGGVDEDAENDRAAAPRTSAPWLVDMLVALDRQLSHVEHNLSHYFSPNTHLTGEALALYVVGLALPELAGSDRRVETGRRILIREIDRQILGDGGHAERSAHYHRYTLDFYLLALLTATRLQDHAATGLFADAVSRLATFTRVLADDTGRLPLIGDDDGGMLWPMMGRACHDVRDSLALASILLGRADLAPWGVPEEVFWIAGRTAVERAALATAPHGDTRPFASRALAATGYFVARDGRGGHAVLDAGPHGYLNGGHAHADPLALTLTLANRPLLIDPGTSTYTMNAILRDRMRGSASHNTITLNDRSPAIPAGPFHWRTRADARLHAWRQNPGFDWVEASHDGYAPARHRRSLLRTADSGWLVLDEIQGPDVDAATAHWHFEPAWMLRCDAPGRLRATHLEGDMAWLLHDAGDLSLVHGDEDSGLGWYAPAYGTLIPTWTARITRRGKTPLTMMTWIDAATGLGGNPPRLERVEVTCESGGRACGACVTSGDRAAVFMLRPGAPDAADARSSGILQYQTNARVLHYRDDGGRWLALDLADASHALALRDGWLTVAATESMPDFHAALDEDVLDLSASAPAPRLRIQGGALQRARTIRVNGRDLPSAVTDRPESLVIHGGDWGDHPDLRPVHARRSLPTEIPAF